MVTLAFEVPPSTKRGPIVLVIILEKENLDRMREADPFDIQTGGHPQLAPFADRRLRDLDIIIAYEEDLNALLHFKKTNDLPGFMRWIERGRKIVAGDCLPPVPLRKM